MPKLFLFSRQSSFTNATEDKESSPPTLNASEDKEGSGIPEEVAVAVAGRFPWRIDDSRGDGKIPGYLKILPLLR